MLNGCGDVRVQKNIDACLEGAFGYTGDIGQPVLQGGAISLTAEVIQSGFIARNSQLYQQASLSVNGTINWAPVIPVDTTWLIVGGSIGWVGPTANKTVTFQLLDPDGIATSPLQYTTATATEATYLNVPSVWGTGLISLQAFAQPWTWRFQFSGGVAGDEANILMVQHEVANGLAL